MFRNRLMFNFQLFNNESLRNKRLFVISRAFFQVKVLALSFAKRSVYIKCDFNPICCRAKFHPVFDISSWRKYLLHNSNPNDFAFYRLF